MLTSVHLFLCVVAPGFLSGPQETRPAPTEESAPSDELAEDLRAIDAIRTAAAGGDHEAARRLFAAFLDRKLSSLCGGVEDEGALEPLRELARTGKALGEWTLVRTLREEIYRRSLAFHGADSEAAVDDELNHTSDLFTQGRFREALPHARHVFEFYESTGFQDPPMAVTAASNLTVGLLANQKLDEAEVASQRAVSLAEEHLDAYDIRTLDALMNRAFALYSLQKPKEAVGFIEELLSRVRQSKPQPDRWSFRAEQLMCIVNLGRGRVEEAVAGFERLHAVSIEEGGALSSNALMVASNLGAARVRLGDSTGAVAVLREVDRGYQAAPPTDIGQHYGVRQNLAAALRRIGDFDAALAVTEGSFNEALSTKGTLENPDVLGLGAGHARALLGAGRYAEALALSTKCVDAVEAGAPAAEGLSRAINVNHGLLLILNGHFDQAEPLLGGLSRALGESAKGSLDAQHATVLHAMALRGLGRNSEAEKRTEGQPSERLQRFLRKDTTTPRAVLQAASFARNRIAYARFSAPLGAAPFGVTRDSFVAYETIRHTIAELRSRGARESLQDSPFAAEYDELQERLNSIVLETPWEGADDPKAAIDAWRETIQGCVFDIERIRRESQGKTGLEMPPREALTLDRLCALLGPDELAVGYHSLPRWEWDEESNQIQKSGWRHVAYVFDAAGGLRELDLGPAADIDRAIEAWLQAIRPSGMRSGLGGGTDAAVTEREAGSALRRLLVDPVLAALPRENAPTRLHVCLDGPLHTVPFAALPMESQTADLRLGDTLSVRRHLTFMDLAGGQAKPNDAHPSVLLVGDVDYDGSPPAGGDTRALPGSMTDHRGTGETRWPSLGFTAEEVSAVALLAKKHLQVEAVTLGGDIVAEPTLRSMVKGKSYVHVATHGWFMPASVRSLADYEESQGGAPQFTSAEAVAGLAPLALSGLVLSGINAATDSTERSARLLTAQEIASFDLTGCELAVLSACETSAGVVRAGQGIQSMQTALRMAGARASVTALWRVSDFETKDLMRDFYGLMWEEGLPPEEALWKAQQRLRKGTSRGPHAWAGWVIVTR